MKTTDIICANGESWLRRCRGWTVILLMVVLLIGGYRTANRVTEETSSEQTSEVVEYAHRLVEGCQRSLGRCATSRLERASAQPLVAGVSGSRVGDWDGLGSVSSRGHQLPNGLCAPQRC